MLRAALALVTAAGIGCGPVAYVSQVTLRADAAVEAAREARAETYSPYYWTRATEYLHMAREVGAHADYQGANRFGRLATEAAIKAKAEAEDPAHRAAAGDPPSTRKPGLAPAKDAIAPAKDEP